MTPRSRPRAGAPWRPVHREVLDHVRARPGAEALVDGGRSVSYHELGAASAALARCLRASGVGPEVRVGLVADRTAAAIIGMLGILRAGAAFVPVDPTFPLRRVRSILADGVDLVVGESSTVDGLGVRVPLVRLDELGHDGAADLEPDETHLHPDHTAYVIYTSGSTGRPKGVANTHRGLAASTRDRHAVYADPVGTFLLLSSLAVDSSLAGIFWTLAGGGRLVLPPSMAEADIQSIVSCTDDQRATHLLALPRLYRLLLTHAPPGSLRSLRVAIVAGEPWPSSLVDLHRSVAPGASLYSEWGVTEASVWSTVCEASRAVRNPLGTPIPSAEIYVLDERLRQLPLGATGEVCVAGPGLARGYLHQPGLTAERFLPNPFAGGGQRLYRTGDLARRLPGGEVRLVGRADEQVKIRGYRVEVGEVDAAIREHPSVVDAATSAERHGTRVSLVAYVVPAPDTRPQADLRRHLRAALAPYAVPSQLHFVPTLPRLPNGKLDRASLPRLRQPEAAPAATPAPASRVESVLLAVWREVLEDESITVDDDFFALNGDSLAAMQIVSRIRSELDVQVGTDAVLLAPTVRRLAKVVAARRR